MTKKKRILSRINKIIIALLFISSLASYFVFFDIAFCVDANQAEQKMTQELIELNSQIDNAKGEINHDNFYNYFKKNNYTPNNKELRKLWYLVATKYNYYLFKSIYLRLGKDFKPGFGSLGYKFDEIITIEGSGLSEDRVDKVSWNTLVVIRVQEPKRHFNLVINFM